MREYGKAGQDAAAETTGEKLIAMWKYMETAFLPLHWQAFNAHQHGDKVKAADRLLLADRVNHGEGEGWDMGAVREILRRWN